MTRPEDEKPPAPQHPEATERSGPKEATGAAERPEPPRPEPRRPEPGPRPERTVPVPNRAGSREAEPRAVLTQPSAVLDEEHLGDIERRGS